MFGAGFVDAAWNVSSADIGGVAPGRATHVHLELDSSHHEGSRGVITLALAELAGRPSTVIINGVTIWSLGRDLCASADGCAGGAQLVVAHDRIEWSGVEPQAVVLELLMHNNKTANTAWPKGSGVEAGAAEGPFDS